MAPVDAPPRRRRARDAVRPPESPGRRLLLVLVVGAVLAFGLVGGSLAGAPPADALGSLPACRYDDILTAPRGYGDWAVTLVDTILRVPQTYIPPDLTPVSAAGLAGSGEVRAVAIPDLTAMASAAKANGTPIAVQSAYRSYATQKITFQYWVNLSGYKQALLYSARPGHSEHQLGLAIDFKSAVGGPPWSGSDWGTSPAGSWMRQHAWEYGFILSYPKGKVAKTCYDYEAWHFRYVGVDEAAAIHASGLTLREYLWRHFTTATVPPAGGSPAPSIAPTAAASPVASPEDSSAASDAPSLEPSVAPTNDPGTPGPTDVPDATDLPVAPAGTWLGFDPAVVTAAAALIAVLAALLISLVVGRRPRSRMGPKGL